MAYLSFALASILAVVGQSESRAGSIRGVVVNGSRQNTVCPRAEVVLRAKMDGPFTAVAKTTADEQGRFDFGEVPIEPGIVYQPGGNHQEIHYPGPQIALTEANPDAFATLRVHDALTHPSPLRLSRWDILIKPLPAALQVTEALTIVNPTSSTFVGQAESDDSQPVTLRLSIPANFERCTFREEFLGRNFEVVNDKMVTRIPWKPGVRKVEFTYTVPNSDRRRIWDRPCDLPCDAVRMLVEHGQPQEIACSLGKPYTVRENEVIFTSSSLRPADAPMRVELGRQPVHWTRYARWIALVSLAACVAATWLYVRRRNPRPPTDSAPQAESLSAESAPSARAIRAGHRNHSRKAA